MSNRLLCGPGQCTKKLSNKYKNGCRDDTVPKTGNTRRHCEVELTVCNNLPQPPSLHLVFWGLRKIVAYCQLYLAVPPRVTCFWHGVIPTSYFIFNDFYTCVYNILWTPNSTCSVRALVIGSISPDSLGPRVGLE